MKALLLTLIYSKFYFIMKANQRFNSLFRWFLSVVVGLLPLTSVAGNLEAGHVYQLVHHQTGKAISNGGLLDNDARIIFAQPCLPSPVTGIWIWPPARSMASS